MPLAFLLRLEVKMKLIKKFEYNEKLYSRVSKYFFFLFIGIFIYLVYGLINATVKLIKFDVNIFGLTVFPFVTLFLFVATSGIICDFQSRNYRDKIKILKAINNQ